MSKNNVEILIVDDNMDDVHLTIHSLQKNNVANSIFHVKDGEEALDFIFALGEYSNRIKTEQPKLILLDIKMPKINGIEVLEKLKSDPVTKTIPIVMLTSSKEDPNVKKCYALGANSYITKPIDFKGFAKAIKELGLYWIISNVNT